MKFLKLFKKNDEDHELQIESRYASGTALMKNGRLEEALIQFKVILGLDPNYTFAHYHIGEIYQQKEDFETALIHFKQALRISESEIVLSNIHIALATTFYSLGQLEQAIEKFKEAIELNPKRRDLHLDIGEIYYQIGEIDKAINHFQQTDQQDPTAQVYLAKAYWAKNDHQKSLHILREANNNFPENPEILAYLGYLLLEKEAYVEAIDVLRKVLEFNSEPDEQVLIDLGRAHYESGDFEEALNIYNQAVNLFPDNLFFYKRIGFIHEKQDDLDGAIRVWRRMVEIDKSNPEAHTTLSFGLRLSGNFEAALQAVQQAFEADATYAPAYTSEGNILLDMGKTDAAITSFEQAINLGDEWALLNLAEVYQDLGNTDKASHYAKAFINAAEADTELKPGVKDATAILNESEF